MERVFLCKEVTCTKGQRPQNFGQACRNSSTACSSSVLLILKDFEGTKGTLLTIHVSSFSSNCPTS